MERKKQNLRTLLLFGLSALALLGVIFLLFFRGLVASERQTIVLPDASTAQQQDPPAQQTAPMLLDVSRENAQSILASLSRPAAYRQSFRADAGTEDDEFELSVQLWVDGEKLRAQLTTPNETRCYLTDGKTLYVWYEGDREAVSFPADDSLRIEELIGVPIYETLQTLSKTQIIDASFTQDGGADCIYLKSMRHGVTREYWVGVKSGLLRDYSMETDGRIVYTLHQEQLELLASGDEALSSAFYLPDGSAPFA